METHGIWVLLPQIRIVLSAYQVTSAKAAKSNMRQGQWEGKRCFEQTELEQHELKAACCSMYAKVKRNIHDVVAK